MTEAMYSWKVATMRSCSGLTSLAAGKVIAHSSAHIAGSKLPGPQSKLYNLDMEWIQNYILC